MIVLPPHPKIKSAATGCNTHFLIANRHLFSSDRQIALVSSAGIPLRQRSPHIDIVHLKGKGHWKSTQCISLTLVTEFRLLNVHAEIECPCRNPLPPVEYEHTGSYSNEICRSAKISSKFECSCRNELPHAAFSWEGVDSQWEKVYFITTPPASRYFSYTNWSRWCVTRSCAPVNCR